MPIMIRTMLAVLVCCVAIPARAQDSDTCGAAGFQGLVGQTAEIARMLELDRPLRIIPPDSMVTMDFRPDRINFEIDAEGRIAVVRCG
jgi:hypothetical protein